eukprot:2938730-Lingulodinium_polyedra.AAC.1
MVETSVAHAEQLKWLGCRWRQPESCGETAAQNGTAHLSFRMMQTPCLSIPVQCNCTPEASTAWFANA